MWRIVSYLIGLCVCVVAGPRDADARAIRIAYTTDLRGNLTPCSCPVRPLGGLARRIGWIDSLRSAPDREPLFVLDAGGSLPRADDFPNLGPLERERLLPLFRDASTAMGYDAMAGIDLQANEARLVARDGVRLAVVAASEAADLGKAAARIRSLGKVDVTVVLCAGDLHFATSTARRLGAQVAVVSCGACFGGPIWKEGVLLLGPGRAGRYVGLARIDVRGDGSIRALDVRLRAMDGSVPVDPAWQARIEKTVLDIETRVPGALVTRE